MFDSPLLLTAFIGVMLASVSTSLLSVPVTMNKVSFMSEAFAHITFSGIALALLFEWNVTAVSLIAVIFFSLLISFLTKNNRSEQVNITMIFLAVSMAVSVILLSFNERYTVDLAGYLFGNFLFMTPADLKASAVLIALNAVYLGLFYRWLFYWSYNPQSAQVYGIPVNFVYYTFMVLIAADCCQCCRDGQKCRCDSCHRANDPSGADRSSIGQQNPGGCGCFDSHLTHGGGGSLFYHLLSRFALRTGFGLRSLRFFSVFTAAAVFGNISARSFSVFRASRLPPAAVSRRRPPSPVCPPSDERADERSFLFGRLTRLRPAFCFFENPLLFDAGNNGGGTERLPKPNLSVSLVSDFCT